MSDITIPDELLETLACPKCHGSIELTGDAFTCDACKLAYAIVDGVPNFLIDEARPLDGGNSAS